jgi:hypothetical protein
LFSIKYFTISKCPLLDAIQRIIQNIHFKQQKKILNQTPLPMCNGVSLFLSSKVVIIISGKFFKILKTWFVSFLAKASQIR